MTQYVIHKSSRPPNFVTGSYSGATWDACNARHRYKDFYTDRTEALLIAFYLSENNKVSFNVSAVPEAEFIPEDGDPR
jgi:hypothetical protein